MEVIKLYKAHASGAFDPLLMPHAAYRSLADTDDEQRSRYRALVAQALDKAEVDRIRADLQQQRALGPDRFQRVIKTQLGRCATFRAAHRPKLEKAL